MREGAWGAYARGRPASPRPPSAFRQPKSRKSRELRRAHWPRCAGPATIDGAKRASHRPSRHDRTRRNRAACGHFCLQPCGAGGLRRPYYSCIGHEMLWPIILPLQITFWLFAALIGFLTACAPAWKWRRNRTFSLSLLSALLLFVPSCTGIMSIVDAFRFGKFRHASFSDVNDPRVGRYLPTAATDITLIKHPSGHLARYSISESDLKNSIDDLWKQYGKRPATPREDLHEHVLKNPMNLAEKPWIPGGIERELRSSEWQVPGNSIELHSPVESDGGGATYFYDPATRTAYHSAGYW